MYIDVLFSVWTLGYRPSHNFVPFFCRECTVCGHKCLYQWVIELLNHLVFNKGTDLCHFSNLSLSLFWHTFSSGPYRKCFVPGTPYDWFSFDLIWTLFVGREYLRLIPCLLKSYIKAISHLQACCWSEYKQGCDYKEWRWLSMLCWILITFVWYFFKHIFLNTFTVFLYI